MAETAKEKSIKLVKGGDQCSQVPEGLVEEITPEDERRFFEVVSVDLDQEQQRRISTPSGPYPRVREVLAVHWHPEFVPMELIKERIEANFPNKRDELIIPTQHNEILEYGDYAGVEVDCYSRGFNRKVQLLLHFRKERVQNASILRSMLEHTHAYRASQLYDFIHTITGPVESRVNKAALETGADEGLVEFVRVVVSKIERMIEKHYDEAPKDSLKNKLLRNYFDTLRPDFGDAVINRVQTYLKAVKVLVKEDFSLKYFYRTSEIIEEVRSLGGGIVIPHPEQFWPILLADYDVDGVEVWNPQSRKYTDFLITVLNEKNKRLGPSRRRHLVFMGDDCHMGEKVKAPARQDKAKASREIGIQPWDDLMIRKELIVADMVKERIIEEYSSRLEA
jgi:hypothetical protein